MKRLLFFGLLLLLVINSSGLKGHFRFSFSSNKQHKISFTKFAARTVIPPSNLAPDLPKTVFTYILSTQLGKKVLQILPAKLVTFLAAIYPLELVLFVVFQLAHRRVLKFAHSSQSIVWQLLALGTPYEWNKSILGFAEERGALLAKLLGLNYFIKLMWLIISKLGFQLRDDVPSILARISYSLYFANVFDLFKSQFLHTFFPNLAENKRQSYVVNRSTSVVIWIIALLIVCEMISSYLKVPLSSTLAFGGVGGLAVGLSARDVAANLLGGMMLLFNEPFTPGDMVTFRTGSSEFIGRVERVGWGQTRIRGRDTRPTYVPNSHFVQTAVTNMERITHRKFEATVPVRFEDYKIMAEIISRIKERLRTISKLDVLSMPFRVSFVSVGQFSLQIEVVCYFATKSIDEFLNLQQAANLEIIAAIHDCHGDLALPSTVLFFNNDAQGLLSMSNVAINNNMNQSSLSAEKPSRSPNDSVGEKSQFAQNRNKSNDKESETIRSEGGKKNDGQEYLSSQNTWRNLTRSAGIATDGRKFFESESEVIDPTRSDSFYYNPGERKARLDNEYKQEDRYIDVIENDDEHPY